MARKTEEEMWLKLKSSAIGLKCMARWIGSLTRGLSRRLQLRPILPSARRRGGRKPLSRVRQDTRMTSEGLVIHLLRLARVTCRGMVASILSPLRITLGCS